MPEQWEIELTQIRTLMRNEVTNHNRIRERVIHMRDLYYSGVIADTQELGWDKWAVSYFANSPENLRRLLGEHPNSVDQYARRQLKRDEEEARHRQRLEDEERKRTRTAELKASKIASAKEREKAKPKSPPITAAQYPPHQLMLPLIETAGVVKRKTQAELGAIYVEAKRLVDTHRVGNNPRTGKVWRWGDYGPIYFGFTRQWIGHCIKAHEENVNSVSNSDDGTVVPLRGA